MQHNTRNQVPSASKPSFHLDMKTSESFLLAFLVWFVSCDSVNVPACQTECLAFPRMPSFFEIGHTPVTGLGVKCRVVATSQTKHHVCLLNITGFISKISPTQKNLIFYFAVQCTLPIRLTIWNTRQMRKNAISYLQFAGPCELTFMDIEKFGKVTDLRVLYMLNGATFARENSSFHGLNGTRNIGSVIFQNQNFRGRFPKVFTRDVWTRLAEVNFWNVSFGSLPLQELKRTMPNLQSLELSYNRLTKPPSFPWCSSVLHLPRNLRRTSVGNQHYGFGGRIKADIYRRYLILDYNQITNLSTYEFFGFLHKLSLKGNGLQVVGSSCFINLTGTLAIDLSQNSLRKLPGGIFQGQQSLVELRLDFNKIDTVPADIFKDLLKLERLYLSHNQLREIPKGLLTRQKNLEVVHLEGNNIIFISESSFPEQASSSLKEVYLNNNNLHNIPVWALLCRSLTFTDLSDNEITFNSLSDVMDSFNFETLYYQHRKSASSLRLGLTTKKSLKLTNNRVKTVNIEGFNETKLAKFVLVLRVYEIDLGGNPLICDCKMLKTKCELRKLIHADEDVSEGQFDTWKCSGPPEVKGRLLTAMDEEQFMCKKQLARCPASCRCSVRAVDGTISIDCRGRNLTRVPKDLPTGRLELHLENNQIEVIPPYAFLENVTGLYLSHNNIRELNDTSLLRLTRIRDLYFDNNKLTELPEAIRKVPFMRLDLQQNFFKCDCHARWMKYWLKNVTQRVVAVGSIRCNTGVAQGKPVVEVDDRDFRCKSSNDRSSDTIRFYERTVFRTVAFTCVGLLLLIIVTVALVYKFRGEVKVLLYTRFNWHPFDRLDDSDSTKIYDAFVSYSGHDHGWVWSTLREQLETHEPPYKLCIHDRDFLVGAPIQENILNSVHLSKRMIMVLSRNFIRSEWCLLEFRAAHRRVLEERMSYLIIVLLEDLKTEELDSEIQLYMRSNTYLSVKNKWFWQKLFYAMPQKDNKEIESSGEPGDRDNSFRENEADVTGSCFEIGIVNQSDVTAVSLECQDSYL